MVGWSKVGAAMSVAGMFIGMAGEANAASPYDSMAARSLGRTVAAAATGAEASAPRQTVAPAVRGAVENAIIVSAAEPLVVLAALDDVLTTCRPTGRNAQPGWSCPSLEETYAAIRSLRGIVVSQLEQSDPASLKTPGFAPIGSVPITSPGGSNYRGL